jgi:hypothetical protein
MRCAACQQMPRCDRGNATARETIKHHNSRVLTATQDISRVISANTSQPPTIGIGRTRPTQPTHPGKLAISSHPIPSQHITCHSQRRLPRVLYLHCGTVCALPQLPLRRHAYNGNPPTPSCHRLGSPALLVSDGRHLSLYSANMAVRIAADNNTRVLHPSPRLPVLALCRRVTGAAADALSRLASIGGVALALHLRSTSTLPHPSRRPITIYLLVFQHC